MNDILVIVLPVFLVIGAGSVLKWTRLVDAAFLFQLNRVVYFLALPALLFYKIATADFSASFNATLLFGLLASTLIGFVASSLYSVFRAYPPAVRGTFTQGAFRGNIAYIGLALVNNACGEHGMAAAGILLGFLVPAMNFLAIIALLMPYWNSGQRMGAAVWLRQICGNPLIIASFAGIAWSFFRLPMPKVVDAAFRIITSMALPLALISIGASFSWEKLRGDLRMTMLATGIKLIVMPALAVLVLALSGIRGQELVIGVLFAGTPTATAAYIMAQQMKGDAELSGSIIMLSTLLSVLTYTAALYCLKALGL